METVEQTHEAHVLVVILSIQGHINPLLQFSKRLFSKGIKVRLAITTSVAKSMHTKVCPISFETFSDGYDDGFKKEDGIESYLERSKLVGSQTLGDLIKKLERLGNPISCVVYDSFYPWVLDVAKQFNLPGASFFTQSCAVCNIYYHVQQGLLKVPVDSPTVSIPGLPLLAIADLPSFVSVYGSHPGVRTIILNQFSNIDKADWLLFNTFDRLEDEVVKWMSNLWPIKTVGPTVPSIYLDKRIEKDKDYGLDLFDPRSEICMNWLNKRETNSVIYVSFGSTASVAEEQMKEIAWALKGGNKYFLWVVRESEKRKLPSDFAEEVWEKGLVVQWCPQLEVLSHKAVGCFVTHCGWNSTLESLCLGIPMVELPQWSDQTTNAKFVEDEWEVGLRTKVDENGISRREEIEVCIREVTEGEKGKEMRMKCDKWKQLAKEAVDEGGSSDKNIEEFIRSMLCTIR
ncbi:mogroside IE synthase-like [Macadamia integrifolia]|uniref:mogroside IE synthase-like n=1 Tax=Macadamia integrifolia TaxID=60698 RepID=UPI001C4FB655|nr:mogroside IE synthase-like [Macadamia integrifolia]